jgi:hypothetical protein
MLISSSWTTSVKTKTGNGMDALVHPWHILTDQIALSSLSTNIAM